MRRIAVLFFALIMTVAFTACSTTENVAKSPAVADVAKTVRSEISFPDMTEQLAEDLQYYGYGDLSTADIEEAYFAIASTGQTPEEIMIVKMKDDSKTADVKKLMEARRDNVAETAADYTPELVEQLENAVIETKGAYAYYVVSGDSKKAKDIFDAQF